jgi:hypothetical protein
MITISRESLENGCGGEMRINGTLVEIEDGKFDINGVEYSENDAVATGFVEIT